MKIWKEKWNYQPVFVGKVSAETKLYFSLPKINEIYNVSSVSWSDFESCVIAKVLSVSNYLLKVNNIRHVKVHKKQIIILKKDVFIDKVANKDNQGGKFSYGYIYVCRDENKVKFLSDLAHELSHLLSYYSLAISESKDRRSVSLKKDGYSIFCKDDDLFYDGLNEAVTDLWSKVILKQLFRIYPRILSEKQKEEALNFYAYPYHVTLLEEIIFNMTKDDVLVWPLFESYFDGSSNFLNLLENELPALAGHIKTMSSKKESVLKVAEIIGDCSLLEKIRKIYPGAK
jgi:hypothetical protein